MFLITTRLPVNAWFILRVGISPVKNWVKKIESITLTISLLGSNGPPKFGYFAWNHYDDVIMTTMASQITCHMIVYSTVYSGADQRKHQSSASRAFARGIHWGPANSPHKWPVTRKMFPFDDVIKCKLLNFSAYHFASAITQGWSNVHFIDWFPVNWYRNKEFSIVKFSLLNVPICTQGMQRTWWPEAGTIIVTGSYYDICIHWRVIAIETCSRSQTLLKMNI